MTPELVIIIAQALIRYGPGIAEDITNICTKPNPTVDDWTAIFAKVKTKEQIYADAQTRSATITTTNIVKS